MSHLSITIVVLLSLLAIMLFVVGYRSRRKQTAAKPLDLTAFRTLMDRDDEAFLREKLSRAEFFHQKRLRIRVTWKYVRRIADNSAVVLRHVATSPDPEVRQLEDLAAQLRMNCLVDFAKLALEFAIPSVQLTPAMLALKYESLRQNLSRLGRLHPQDLAPLASAM